MGKTQGFPHGAQAMEVIWSLIGQASGWQSRGSPTRRGLTGDGVKSSGVQAIRSKAMGFRFIHTSTYNTSPFGSSIHRLIALRFIRTRLLIHQTISTSVLQ